jgi:hypothetical protein
VRHHFLGEQAQARHHLVLRHHLVGVEDEVDAIDAERFPLLDGADDARRIAVGHALGLLLVGVRSGCRAAQCRQQAERLVGRRGEHLAGRDQLCREIVEGVAEALAHLDAGLLVLVAEQEVGCGDLLVHERADRLAMLDAPPVLLDLLLLLVEAREGQAEAAQPAVGRVDLCARAGDRHPHRRVWFLVGLGQDGALGHRPELTLVGEGLLHPHLGQAAHELVPALLGRVGIGAEAAELGPGRRAAGADMQAPAREDIQRRGLLGDLDRMVELGNANHDAMPDLDILGQHRTRGEKQLGRRAVRIFLEEMVFDRPDMLEAQRIGELHLLEAVVVNRTLLLGRPGTRDRDLVEQAELHVASPDPFAKR